MNIETVTVPTFSRMKRQYKMKQLRGHVFTARIGDLERQFIIHKEGSFGFELTDCKSGQLIDLLPKRKAGATESAARHLLDQLCRDLDPVVISLFFRIYDLQVDSIN